MKKGWIILIVVLALLILTAVLLYYRFFVPKTPYTPGTKEEVILNRVEYEQADRESGALYRILAVREQDDGRIRIMLERRLSEYAETVTLEAEADGKLFDRLEAYVVKGDLQNAAERRGEADPSVSETAWIEMTLQNGSSFRINASTALSEREQKAWQEILTDLEEAMGEYRMDYGTGKNLYEGAEDTYRAGEKVELCYDLIATDTDYTFLLDGEPVRYDYDEKRGFVLTFIMPDHDAVLECRMKNSMEYDPYAGKEDMVLTVDGVEMPGVWEENAAVDALRKMSGGEEIVVEMNRYGGFEQVGSIGAEITRNDEQTVTEPGDIVLYNGNQLVIFYGSNSWAYTRLGHIGLEQEELEEYLGGDSVTAILWAPAEP